MSEVVVDASALLAVLNQEPGTERWATAFKDAVMSAVNLSEVVAKLTDVGMPEKEIRLALEPLGLEIVPFDAVEAYEAGLLRAPTRGFGLSLGDRACLSLARSRTSPVLTADRAWSRLRLGLEIRLVR
ncbi:MAG: type II toxin-antitoxin system VapC family toxin [bacterium]